MRFGSLRVVALAAVMVVALMATMVGRGVSARDATPEPMADMGSASAALGMGSETDAFVNILHLSPDAPGVDIAVTGGDVLIPNLEFPAASDYLEVPAAAYDLEVRLAGTDTVALPLPGVELQAGMVYSVYAIGLAGDGSLTVLPVVSPSEGAVMATPEATPSM